MLNLTTHLLGIALGFLLCLLWPTKGKRDYAKSLYDTAEDIFNHYGDTVPNSTKKAFIDFWVCRLNDHFRAKI